MFALLLEDPLFNITFFGGLIFVTSGFIQLKFPPKNINSLYGYRTIQSMKNQERWNFAQNFSAKELMKSGFLLTLSSALAFIIEFAESTNLVIGISLMITVVIFLFLRVEKAIENKFDE